MKKYYIILVTTLICMFSATTGWGQYHGGDLSVLNRIIDSNFTVTTTLNWATEPNPGNWIGVDWDAGSPMRVVGLNLANVSANMGTGQTTDLTGNVDVRTLDSLGYLYLQRNSDLNSINASGLSALTTVRCGQTNMVTVDVSNCTKLDVIKIKRNSNLSTLNITGCTALNKLAVSQNALTSINVAGLTNLQYLGAKGNIGLTTVNTSGATNLIKLKVCNSSIGTVDVTGMNALTSFRAGKSVLTDIVGIEALPSINRIRVKNNKINFDRAVQIFNHPVATDVNIINQSGIPGQAVALNDVVDYSIYDTVTVLGGDSLTLFELYDLGTGSLVSSNNTGLFTMTTAGAYYVSLSNSGYSSSTGVILVDGGATPDPSFSNADYLILMGISSNNFSGGSQYNWGASSDLSLMDGVVWNNATPRRVTELNLDHQNAGRSTGKSIFVSGSIDLSGLDSLQSFEAYQQAGLSGVTLTGLSDLNYLGLGKTGLTTLDASNLTSLNIVKSKSSSGLSSINFSGCTSLTEVKSRNCILNTINLSGCTNLDVLGVANNKLAAIDLTDNIALSRLGMKNNQISSVTGLSGLSSLTKLIASQGNNISSIDLSGLTALQEIRLGRNNISNLSFAGLTNLTRIGCGNNQLTSLDVTGLTNLTHLGCRANMIGQITGFMTLPSISRMRAQDNKIFLQDAAKYFNKPSVTDKNISNQRPYPDIFITSSDSVDYSDQALIDINGSNVNTNFTLYTSGGSFVSSNTTGIFYFPGEGDYYVVMDNSGVSINTGNINVTNPPYNFNVSVDSTTGCSPLMVNIANNSSGGTGSELYYFQFNDGSDTITWGPANISHTYYSPGEYNLLVVAYDSTGWGGNPNNLIYLSQANIMINVTGLGNMWSSDSICPGADAWFDANASGGTYLWDFGDGTTSTMDMASHTFDSAGTFPVTLTYTSVCGVDVDTTYVVVSTNASPDARFRIEPWQKMSCPNDEFVFEHDGPSSEMDQFDWDFGDGTMAMNADRRVFHGYADTGMYVVTLTMTNACGNSDVYMDTVYVNGSLAFDNIGLWMPGNCPGDNLQQYIYGGGTYQSYVWDFGNGDSAFVQNPIYAYADTGSYNVRVTVTNGCGIDTTIESFVSIGNNIYPDLSNDGYGVPDEGNGSHCPGDSVLFYYAGIGTVSWDFGDGNSGVPTELLEITEGSQTMTVTIIRHPYADTGTYYPVITVTNGCGNSVSDTIMVVISNGSAVSGDFVWDAAPQPGNHLTCQPVKFFSFGGGTYDWNFGDGDSATTTNGVYAHAYTDPGTYNVMLTVTNGCGLTDVISTPITIDPMLLSYNITNETCKNDNTGAIDLMVNGIGAPYAYMWNTGAMTEDISGLAGGNYSVTVTDSLGCQITDTVMVNPGIEIQLTMGSQDASCASSNGKAWVTATGGMTGYSYSWSPGGSTTDSVLNAAPVVYVVTVMDSAGCTAMSSIGVATSTPPTVDAGLDQTICAGSSATLTASGTAVGYLWSNSANTPSTTVSPTSTTTYSVVGTSLAGCVGTDNVTVNVVAAPSANAGIDQTVCAGSNVALTAASSTGSGLWSGYDASGVFVGGGNTNPIVGYQPTASEVSAGSITFVWTVSDTNGICADAVDSMMATISAMPVVNAGMDDSVCISAGGVVTLSGTVSNASGGTWTTNGAGSFSSSTDLNGTYTAAAQDVVSGSITITLKSTGNGVCSAVMDNLTLSVFDAPVVNAGVDTTICGGDGITLSGTGAASYIWNNGVTDGVSFTPFVTATYTLSGTSAEGCVGTDQVTVTVNAPTVNAGVDVMLCAGDSTTLSATGTATSYSWDNSLGAGATHTVTPSNTTTYIVTGTDVATCIAKDTVIVTVNPLPTPVVTYADSASTGSYATYQWYMDGTAISGATSQILSSTDLATSGTGAYSVEVTDSNGCSGISDTVNIVIGGVNGRIGTQVSIYPNPSAGMVNIAVAQITPNMQVQIFNELGQSVYFNSDMEKLVQVELETGVYFVRIRDSFGTTTEKLVVTK